MAYKSETEFSDSASLGSNPSSPATKKPRRTRGFRYRTIPNKRNKPCIPDTQEPAQFDRARIPLSRGLFAKIDAEDYDWVSKHKWSANPSKSGFYAHRQEKGRKIYLHKAVLGITEGIGDHINRDTLDCRKRNLRKVSHAVNVHNGGPRRSKSGLRGVILRNGRYVARIKIDGQHRWLGTFNSPEDATKAYQEASRRHYGIAV